MRVSQLAERRALALERIVKVSGMDLSGSAFPKAPDLAHREMHVLEAVAAHLEAQAQEQEQATSADPDAVLERISSVKGVGPATMVAIREALQVREEVSDGS